jgi:glycerol uptake facilitator-like aquaporin
VLILALAPISGAHFNPAVSLVMTVAGGLSWTECALYAMAQVIGGCLGALLAHAMFDLPLWQSGIVRGQERRSGWPSSSPPSAFWSRSWPWRDFGSRPSR